MKDLNKEYSRIQMKIIKKAKWNVSNAYNKASTETCDNYQKLYQRNKRIK